MKPALARPSTLAALLLCSVLAANVSAQTPEQAPPANPNPQPTSSSDAPPSPAASAPAAQAPDVSLPDLNPAEYFDGKQGGTFGGPTVDIFGRNNKVVVGGFRVVFVNYNEVGARVRGSYMPGRNTGDASSKTQVNLVGVDDATLQKITDAAYEKFIAQLKATGREVVTYRDDPALFADHKPSTNGLDVEFLGAKGKARAPTGMPLWFQSSDAFTPSRFANENIVADAKLSLKHNAIAISPLFVVDFARMESSGNRSGFVARTASTGASLSMSVRLMSGMATRAEEVRGFGVSRGDQGAMSLKKPLDTDIPFAALEKVESQKGGVLSLLGAIGSRTNKQVLNANTTNDDYALAANAVLGNVTGGLAKWLASKPAGK
jgi:hypothetical protein